MGYPYGHYPSPLQISFQICLTLKIKMADSPTISASLNPFLLCISTFLSAYMRTCVCTHIHCFPPGNVDWFHDASVIPKTGPNHTKQVFNKYQCTNEHNGFPKLHKILLLRWEAIYICLPLSRNKKPWNHMTSLLENIMSWPICIFFYTDQ